MKLAQTIECPNPLTASQFETDDPAVVEAYLHKSNINVCWHEDGMLHTRQIRDAFTTHPKTGEPVWHGHPHLFHYSSYPTGGVFQHLVGEENLPMNAWYGDGTPISPDDITVLRKLHFQQATLFTWQQEEVLMLDNLLVAHGRQPFKGDRRILVALAA